VQVFVWGSVPQAPFPLKKERQKLSQKRQWKRGIKNGLRNLYCRNAFVVVTPKKMLYCFPAARMVIVSGYASNASRP